MHVDIILNGSVVLAPLIMGLIELYRFLRNYEQDLRYRAALGDADALEQLRKVNHIEDHIFPSACGWGWRG